MSTELEETLAAAINVDFWDLERSRRLARRLIESGVVADPAEKVLRATIRELEDENTELNNELGTAVQMLKLERDGLRAEVERLKAGRDVEQEMLRNALPIIAERDGLRERNAALVSIGEEILTDALHPEFGYEWQEPDGILWKMAQERDVALAEVERLRVEGEDIFAELKEITRERDSAIVEREALRARLAAVGELAEKWLSRIPHQSGGFYPEASAYDDGRDTSTDACADDLRTTLAEDGA